MIKDFGDDATKRFFKTGQCPRGWQAFATVAARKLDLLNRVVSVEQLRIPPGNRLEKLQGNRKGQWSIRINDQWRVCFRWDDDLGPRNVEIVDYH
jgi:proteic killer suppression protein